jgi:aspartate kinase
MSSHSVEKIGGTSIADTAAALDNVLLPAALKDRPYGRIIVVSAYAGITNRLLEHKKTGQPGIYRLFVRNDSDHAWADAVSDVARRMCAINSEVFDNEVLRADADRFVRERMDGVHSCLLNIQRLCSYGHFKLQEHLQTVREMLSAIGEAHSAFNTMLLLRERGVRSRFVDLTGWRDERRMKLQQRIEDGLGGIDPHEELPIVTGYAQCEEGMFDSFGRGYTEVTFSRIAAQTGAREAIIHKEFHLSSADPKIVEARAARKIGRTNYDVADQLANMGMEAIHPGAAKILRRSGIPLRIRNTFDPQDPGTVISADYVSEAPGVEIITGCKGVYALQVFDPEMAGLRGVDRRILEVIEGHELRVVTKDLNANTVTHFLSGSLGQARRAIQALQQSFPGAEVDLRKVAVVSIIGSDLRVPGLLARAVEVVSAAGIEIVALHQGIRQVDIQVIVAEEDYSRALRVLHGALVERSERRSAGRQAA